MGGYVDFLRWVMGWLSSPLGGVVNTPGCVHVDDFNSIEITDSAASVDIEDFDLSSVACFDEPC